jgi:hypothetical protein
LGRCFAITVPPLQATTAPQAPHSEASPSPSPPPKPEPFTGARPRPPCAPPARSTAGGEGPALWPRRARPGDRATPQRGGGGGQPLGKRRVRPPRRHSGVPPPLRPRRRVRRVARAGRGGLGRRGGGGDCRGRGGARDHKGDRGEEAPALPGSGFGVGFRIALGLGIETGLSPAERLPASRQGRDPGRATNQHMRASGNQHRQPARRGRPNPGRRPATWPPRGSPAATLRWPTSGSARGQTRSTVVGGGVKRRLVAADGAVGAPRWFPVFGV